jgi:adenosine deaminase
MIQRITREMVADAAADNVRYMEIRFTPVALTRINEQPLGDAMDWVIEAAEKASKEYGVKTRLIASVNRHESVELAEEVAKLAAERIERGVAALDLAGAEADFPGDPFKQVFETAKKAGLRITIHAGEWSGPGNVVEAIKELGAERIGHGVRVLEDKKAVNLAKERKTVFEVCVTSNYQSGVVPALKDHPLPQMLAAGLNATINTDDPGISQIDLSDEYELACDGLGLSLAQLKESILNAARAAFLQQSEREALVKQLQAEFKENGA